MNPRLFALLIASLGLYPNIASADPPANSGELAVKDARVRFKRGVEFYVEGNFDAALAEFNKAYASAPNYRVLYNIAQVQVQRHDYVAALQLFEDYLERGGSEIAADRREQVESSLAHLRGRIALLSVNGSVRAELQLDGRRIGTLPLIAPVPVNPGVHDLTLRKDGYETIRHVVTIASGETLRLELPMVAQRPTVAPSAASLPPSAPIAPSMHDARLTTPNTRTETSRAPLWVSLVATAALATASVAFGVLAQDADRELGRMLTKVPADRRAVSDARSEVEVRAVLCDVFMAGALVGGGLSTYFALSGSETNTSESRPDSGTVYGSARERTPRF